MSFFTNKVVLVTGGTDGIGKALVYSLMQQGAKVVTCGRDYDKLYHLQTVYAGKPLLALSADVSNEADCKSMVNQAITTFGTIHILINNAGISMRALFSETDLETIHRVMDINFWGAVYCTKYALPHILKNKGTVAAISSIAGYRGLPGRSGYSASKFALQGWMEALRTELLDSGVNVMWACPGFTKSNIRNVALNKNSQPQGETPLDEESLMSAEEVAEHILKAIEKRKRTLVLSGQGKQTIFLTRFMPELADKLVHKFFFNKGVLVK
ncbi:SDR family oxidoreductase [Parafilimonas terrae]|uniref:Short-chain dehydrogenase n=1 Tax=Parafilimonas terrae TaxID=1465490 RepID=A0A1I5WMI5_9BACT|nr:SDR family oxidoreductase [Parafilimonas terrae]SFQ21004.1 Short-chain dehydrogenase [Parafilimonas terrae]